MNDLEEIVYKHALLNAEKHKGSANPGAVMGSIMANEPELRSRAKEIHEPSTMGMERNSTMVTVYIGWRTMP